MFGTKEALITASCRDGQLDSQSERERDPMVHLSEAGDKGVMLLGPREMVAGSHPDLVLQQ